MDNESKSPEARRKISYFAPILMTFIFIMAAYIIVELEARKRTFIQDFLDALSDPKVVMVRKGSFSECPSVTVEETVNSFMGSPSWEAGMADDGQRYINIEGDITFLDEDVRALMQFRIDEKNDSFELNAIELDGVPSPHFMASELILAMCDSVISEQ